MGIWATGALMITVFYKIALSVHEELGELTGKEHRVVSKAADHQTAPSIVSADLQQAD